MAVFLRVISCGIILAFLGMLYTCSGASAHEDYPSECCSGKDCRPVPASSVRKVGEDWHVMTEDGELVFTPRQVKEPLDDRYHACWMPQTDISLCFFPATGGV